MKMVAFLCRFPKWMIDGLNEQADIGNISVAELIRVAVHRYLMTYGYTND